MRTCMMILLMFTIMNVFLGISFCFNIFKKLNNVMLKIRAWINLDLREIIDKNYDRTLKMLAIDHFVLAILSILLEIALVIVYYYKISSKVGYIVLYISIIVIWIYNHMFMEKLKS
ncbi:hypothetical protein [Clostridium frigidicarnis]|uniref:Uncharacterized protein n=1 Tax=Clostridium frigidicarnis TaxID=84698 RepID=A0A1I1ALP1_9CLOT|nr:hypothetical protein [Clostridium frigidicarnis]SFB37330.1 hypothetical protein SAMN04488528_103710 [Clostridium frigidicarnis]